MTLKDFVINEKEPEEIQELQKEFVKANEMEINPPPLPQLKLDDSEKRDAIIRDLRKKKTLTVDYLNEDQINFMNQLYKNEALLEYYIKLKENIVSMITLSKVVTTSKLKIDDDSALSMGLEAAAEIIPVVGGALKLAAGAKKFADKQELKKNMEKISSLIPFAQAE